MNDKDRPELVEPDLSEEAAPSIPEPPVESEPEPEPTAEPEPEPPVEPEVELEPEPDFELASDPEPEPEPPVGSVVELETEPDFEPESEPKAEAEAAVLAVLEPVTEGTVAEPEVILAKKLVGAASLDPVPIMQSDSRIRCMMHIVIHPCMNSGNRLLYSCVSVNIKNSFLPIRYDKTYEYLLLIELQDLTKILHHHLQCYSEELDKQRL